MDIRLLYQTDFSMQSFLIFGRKQFQYYQGLMCSSNKSLLPPYKKLENFIYETFFVFTRLGNYNIHSDSDNQ